MALKENSRNYKLLVEQEAFRCFRRHEFDFAIDRYPSVAFALEYQLKKQWINLSPTKREVYKKEASKRIQEGKVTQRPYLLKVFEDRPSKAKHPEIDRQPKQLIQTTLHKYWNIRTIKIINNTGQKKGRNALKAIKAPDAHQGNQKAHLMSLLKCEIIPRS